MHSNDVYGEEKLEETCVHSIQYPMRSYELGRLRGTAKAPKGPRSLHWPQRGHCYFLYVRRSIVLIRALPGAEWDGCGTSYIKET